MKWVKFLVKFFTSPSYRLVLNYRIGRFLILHPNPITRIIARWYKYKQITKRNCHISYKSILGNGVHFPHPIGVVIGDNVVVGNDTMIWQNVTLGSHGRKGEKMEYPVIGANVRIYEGATVIGGVKIGDNAIIGSKALVKMDVPIGAMAFGIPARVKEGI